MHIDLEFDPDGRYAVITTSGKASVEDFARSRRMLLEDPRWRSGMSLLIDHRELDSTELSGPDVRAIAANGMSREGFGSGMRVATVVETDLGFGLVRMWDSYSGGERTRDHRIFRSREEAVAWLLADRGEGQRSR